MPSWSFCFSSAKQTVAKAECSIFNVESKGNNCPLYYIQAKPLRTYHVPFWTKDFVGGC